jgi:anti-sigma regulatory factor (Ser/Thr protein kinase)
MGRLNRLMTLFEVDEIITVLYGVVDADLSAFRFVSAGHLPPLVHTRDEQLFVGEGRPDPPLGTGRSHPFREEVVPLDAGASLLLYTDGLIERRNESLTDGLERLRSATASIWAMQDPEEALSSVLDTMLDDAGSPDDVALLLLRLEETSSTRFDMRVSAEPGALVTLRRALRRWLSALEVPPRVRDDVLTAAGEACANAVEHAYGPAGGWVHQVACFDDRTIEVTVRDGGRWRERRSRRGRGMALMRGVVDTVDVRRSAVGTMVTMRKRVPAA